MRNPAAEGHPGLGALADLGEGRLSPEEGRTVEAHAASCAACGATASWLAEARAILGAGAAGEPPRSALRRAFRVPLAARAAAVVGAAREWVARLVFDSGEAAPALAYRGGGPRQLLFRAGPWEIQVTRTEDEVRGSLLPGRGDGAAGVPPGGTASIYRGKRRVAGAPLDARGRFVLRGVPAGIHELRLEAGGTVLRVPDLAL